MASCQTQSTRQRGVISVPSVPIVRTYAEVRCHLLPIAVRIEKFVVSSTRRLKNMSDEILLSLEDVSMDFEIKSDHLFARKSHLSAVNHVSLSIRKNETLGLVGESGCGKSTLANITLGLVRPSSGKVIFEGEAFTSYKGKRLFEIRKKMNKVFQDPGTSLNPRMTVYEILKEPLLFERKDLNEEGRKEIILNALSEVGLNRDDMDRYPGEFSGGQQQRIAILRSLMLNPDYLVLDEPTSSLDASIHGQIMQLLQDFKRKKNVSYLFISHNLNAIKAISDSVAVIYLGRIVEYGKKEDIFANPLHPYTKALLSSSLDLTGKEKPIVLSGEVPSPIDPKNHCRFYSRCPFRNDDCLKDIRKLAEIYPGHFAECSRNK